MKKYGIIVVLAIILLSTAVYSLNTVNFNDNQKAIDNNNHSTSNDDVINESTFPDVNKSSQPIKQAIFSLQQDKTITSIGKTISDSQGKEYEFVGYIDSTPSYVEKHSEGLLEALEKRRNIPMDSGGITPNLISFVCDEVCVNFNFVNGLVSSINNLVSPEALHNAFEGYESCTLNEGSYVNISSPTTMDANGNYINLFWPTVDIRGANGVTCYNYTGYTVNQQTHIKCGDNIYEKLPGFNESFVVEKYVPYESYNKIDTSDMDTSEPASESNMIISNSTSS